MSDRVVPDIRSITFGEYPIENYDIGADDIDWCSGFWNEMAGEITPSLYPDSPIFSSKEYDWDDPVCLENVFVTPDIEETFAGTNMNGHPAFMRNQTNEDVYSVYSSSNSCEPDNILQVGPPSNASKQKYKRPRKPKEPLTEVFEGGAGNEKKIGGNGSSQFYGKANRKPLRRRETENAQDTPSKRQRTTSTKKTKPKSKK